MKSILFAASVAISASAAQATTITFGPTSAGGRGPNIAFDNLVTPTTTTGDATFTFSVRGDLDATNENVLVSIDGFSLGRALDADPSNDSFDFAGDNGSPNTDVHTGSATISNAVIATLINDGFLNLFFDFSSTVNFAGSVNELYGSITFDSSVAPVPLPASSVMLGLGLLGLGGLRRRKSRLSA